jgi:FlaG/FlaF family flagellin (archaellin)
MSGEESSDGLSIAVIAIVAVIVGGILLLVVAVVGAAVIGSFVIGVGEESASSPSAEFVFDRTDEGVTVTHDGGDPLPGDRVELAVNNDVRGTWVDLADDQEVTAGDRVELEAVPEEATVTVIWRTDDQSFTLAEESDL